jgi:hypothetical protein
MGHKEKIKALNEKIRLVGNSTLPTSLIFLAYSLAMCQP